MESIRKLRGSKKGEKAELAPGESDSTGALGKASTSTSSSAPPSFVETSKRRKRDWLRDHLPGKVQNPSQTSMVYAEQVATIKEPVVVENTETPPIFDSLLIKMENADLGGDGGDEKMLNKLEIGIGVIEVFKGLAQIIDLAVPDVLGLALEKITSILQKLKEMIENKQAWVALLTEMYDHQRIFNEQMSDMKERQQQPNTGILTILKQYARYIYDRYTCFSVDSFNQGNGDLGSKCHKPSWSCGDGHSKRFLSKEPCLEIKRFADRFLNTASEADAIKACEKQLDDVMTKFQSALTTYIGITVDRIDKNVDATWSLLAASNNASSATAWGSQHESCLEGTRVDVLEDIRNWARDRGVPVYCIADVAGTGKSTIARSLFEEWKEDKCLAFFFLKGSQQTPSDLCFFVADQIRSHWPIPQLESYWKIAYSNISLLRARNLKDQWEILVTKPLRRLPRDQKRILIVDALDECDERTRGQLLECILYSCGSESELSIQILLTTRMEHDIRKVIESKSFSHLIQWREILRAEGYKGDITRYINFRLDNSDFDTITNKQRNELVKRCDGLFIFASLACKLLDDACVGGEPLQGILSEFTSLDSLYHRTLSQASKVHELTRKGIMAILSVILVAQTPLSIAEITDLLSFKLKQVESLVSKLGSVLNIDSKTKRVYMIHATMAEFLVRRDWDQKEEDSEGHIVTEATQKNQYFIDISKSNGTMAESCFRIMSRELKDDLCGPPILFSPSIDQTNLNSMREGLEQETSAGLRYAASSWIAHVIINLECQDALYATRKFFKTNLLNWIEVEGVYQHLPTSLIALHQLHSAMESLLKLQTTTLEMEDIRWCADTLELLHSNQLTLELSPHHIYSSALIFVPHKGLIYATYGLRFQNSLPKLILGDVTPRPNFTGENDFLKLACSTDGHFFVSIREKGNVVVWHTRTKTRLWSLKIEDPGECIGVSFLPGDQEIVAAWSSGQLFHISRELGILLHSPQKLDIPSEIMYVVWAPKLNQLACSTEDLRIYIFWLDTGSRKEELSDPAIEEISSFSFSHDGLRVAITSNRDIKMWSMADRLDGPTVIWSHTQDIDDGAISPIDSSLFAFMDEHSLYIHSSVTSSIVFQHEILRRESRMAYSPLGDRIAFRDGSDTYTVIILPQDINGTSTSRKLQSFKYGNLIAPVFSHDGQYLATGGGDHTVFIHSLKETESESEEDSLPEKVIDGHQCNVVSVAFSFDGTEVVSLDEDNRVCIWDIGHGRLVQSIKWRATIGVGRVRVSSQGQSIVGLGYREISFKSVKDMVQAGEQRLRLEIKSSYPTAVFSPDNARLAIIANGPQNLLILDIGSPEKLDKPSLITIDPPEDQEYDTDLGYHPSGDFVCWGNSGWDVTSLPILPIAGNTLATVLAETFPSIISVPRTKTLSLVSISFGSPTRQTFYIPAHLSIKVRSENASEHAITQDALLALATEDGRVMILDFKHLCTPEENGLLDRISNMRRETIIRSGGDRLEEFLTMFPWPPGRSLSISRNGGDVSENENIKNEDGDQKNWDEEDED